MSRLAAGPHLGPASFSRPAPPTRRRRSFLSIYRFAFRVFPRKEVTLGRASAPSDVPFRRAPGPGLGPAYLRRGNNALRPSASSPSPAPSPPPSPGITVINFKTNANRIFYRPRQFTGRVEKDYVTGRVHRSQNLSQRERKLKKKSRAQEVREKSHISERKRKELVCNTAAG